ncbi:MAG: hypothetical protein ABR985_19495 [Methanotrichaceae archaeon]
MDARNVLWLHRVSECQFGQIQVHERITETSRELLMQIKEMAENMGYEVLHGIVYCLCFIWATHLVFKGAGGTILPESDDANVCV